jgi:hypothetical protein
MPRLPQDLIAGLLLTLISLLSVGCGTSGSSPIPRLSGVWTGALTETTQHISWAKVNLRLTQDSGNQLSGIVRLYDYALGDKVMCFSVTGTALPGASIHLEDQQADVKSDTPFVQFDGSGATEGYTLVGAYGLGREAIAHLSGSIQQSTPEELDFSCPTPYNVTPTP